MLLDVAPLGKNLERTLCGPISVEQEQQQRERAASP